MINPSILNKLRVTPGDEARLKKRPTGWEMTVDLKNAGKDIVKKQADLILQESLVQLSDAQTLLYADGRSSILIVFQAMDAAGKDGTIKHVMSGVNPQGCQVFSFKKPSDEDLNHNFLWRYARCLPERGRIGIFNRSYYEDVLIVRVHPELLDAAKIPPGKRNKDFWQKRFEDINTFENHLVRNGTTIVKFFLHLSKDEQKKRFLDRLDRREKHWKFSEADLAERTYWDDYQKAYESALTQTSTTNAPWYVIPADDKWATRALVANILTTTIHSLPLSFPTLTAEASQRLAKARERLLNE
jgi:PPK2 family polyphosphate:nucleotide phosphotransferase